MPRSLDPNNTFDVWLDSDSDKPVGGVRGVGGVCGGGGRPTFEAKVLTGREERRVLELADKIQNPESNIEAYETIFESVRAVFCGWRNMGGIDYDPAKFEDVLTVTEALELLGKARAGNQLGADDLGESALPSSPSTAALAGAATLPSQKPSPPSSSAPNVTASPEVRGGVPSVAGTESSD